MTDPYNPPRTSAGWRALLPGQRSVVRVVDVTTGRRRTVFDSDQVVVEAPNWHPVHDELLVNADGELWRIPVSGGEPHVVDSRGNPDANNDHVLSPDGQTIYISNRSGQLCAIPYEGGAPVVVSNTRATPFAHYLHGISPDGQTLVYIGHDRREGVNTFEVYALHLPTGTDTKLTDTARHHDGCEFDAMGERVLFNSERASTRAGHSQLFSMASDGTDVRQLTRDDRVNWFPHQSPDGRRIAYLSYPAGTTGHPANLPVEVRELGPDGSPRTLVALFGGQGTINVNSWARDSRRLAYVEYPIHRGVDVVEPRMPHEEE